jgi:Zn-dependent metalloprotease
LDIVPVLSAEEALKFLKKHIGESLSGYGAEKDDDQTKSYELPIKTSHKPTLLISSGNLPERAENYRLVYRFDVLTTHPTGRYWIDIDANTGSLVGRHAKAYTENIQTTGNSLYNGTVNITISDSSYLEDWILQSSWHTDDWETNGNSGLSWRMADTTLGDFGGYKNEWYELLQTPSVLLEGSDPALTFYHRYSVELPEIYEEYDGWDGMNVRISTDAGTTWEVLKDPAPAYNCTSLFSFGFSHNEGPDIPGWGGIQEDWIPVSFDLAEYAGETIMIRFAFASDPGYSTSDGGPSLFGWQIDDIVIAGSEGILFSNSGTPENMTVLNAVKDVTIIEGKYRLRETNRGAGIATFNGLGGEVTGESVDFVENDLFFDSEINETGVSLHWAVENTYDYYADRFNRHSYDDQNGRIYAYSNWVFSSTSGTTPNNALWSGDKAFFGAGDNTFYSSWGTLDITGHELTHGVTDFTAGLIYENESGALNESFSDIFGTAVEFYTLQEEADWLIGNDHVLAGNVVRSMSNPKSQGDPDTYMGNFWRPHTDTPADENDYGGVHTNSGVQNYWFYLLCEGGSGTNDDDHEFTVTGISIEDAEQIAYRNLSNYLTPNSSYQDAAYYSLQAAADLFGDASAQVVQVGNAWEAVGIYLTPTILAPKSLSIVKPLGTPVNLPVEIKNKGLETLNVNSITLTGEGFTLEDMVLLPYGINYDEVFTFILSFTVESSEQKNGSITISSNDVQNPEHVIPITVNVGPDDILTSPAGSSTSLKLLQNYPNPFHDITSIPFVLPAAGAVRLDIYNSGGENVRRITSSSFPAGEHTLTWDARDDSGNRVPPGIYIIHLNSDVGSVSRIISLN